MPTTDLALKPKDAQAIEAEVAPIVKQAEKVKVTDRDSAEEAGKVAQQINGAIKAVETKRVEYTKPLLETKRTIDEDFKRMLEPLQHAKQVVGGAVMEWRRKEQEKAEAEQARRQKIQEAHAAKGHEVTAPAYVPKPQKTVGGVQAKKVVKFEVEDAGKVPRKFMVVNEAAIRAEVAAQKATGKTPHEIKIAGVRVYEAEQMAVV
jgi:hypothetical protein